MFGISFTEILVIALVALVFVGPQKLPKMLRTVGEWIAKVRSLTSQVRQQTGIDEILKAEGIDGGLSELRNIMRGDLSSVGRSRPRTSRPSGDPYEDPIEYDRTRENPVEGPDAYGALPDDLLLDDEDDAEEQPDTADQATSDSADGDSPGQLEEDAPAAREDNP
ncbi:MAG: twin-arginine translocase subunit TatB [Polyangiaceae bacterium]|nr:twin-arginine translocase subunit TatB [Myxococcales bacterium]MCB9590437.1 twin-arginine translocase subunit TatB [Polyangiaceae bacterium]MCB9608430.1 twin-arginine translocase subunit TatB [Polyangiaceae bacterium]